MDDFKYCYVNKGGEPWIYHRCTSTKRRGNPYQALPWCGARVDTCALEFANDVACDLTDVSTEEDLDRYDLCRKCFKEYISVLDQLAAVL